MNRPLYVSADEIGEPPSRCMLCGDEMPPLSLWGDHPDEDKPRECVRCFRAMRIGGAVAFGLMGMAQAIRAKLCWMCGGHGRPGMSVCDAVKVPHRSGHVWEHASDLCPHGNSYIAECLDCTEGAYDEPSDAQGEDKNG